jgi:hypothetical protein
MQGINSHYSTINLVKEGNGVHKDCLKLVHNLKVQQEFEGPIQNHHQYVTWQGFLN